MHCVEKLAMQQFQNLILTILIFEEKGTVVFFLTFYTGRQKLYN